MKLRVFLSNLLAIHCTLPTSSVMAMQAAPQIERSVLAPRPDPEAARQRLAAAWTEIAVSNFSGAVGIDLGDEVLLREAAGFADHVTRRPYTRDTQFQIGSLTKPFTAAAILKLQDEGRLSVHDPLSRFFPDIPADKAGITLHQLMIHAGGWALTTGGDSTLQDLEPIDRETFLRRAFAAPLLFTPGERLEYSNVGYSLLAAVIEKITGQSYIDHLRASQLDPLGLRETGYREALAPDAVRSLDGQDIVACCWGEGGPYWNLIGNGGLLSTLDDFIAWRKAFVRGQLVSPEAIRQAGTPWIAEKSGEGGEGYGWMIFDSPTRGRVEVAAGGDRRFVTAMHYYPEYDLTMVITANGAVPPAEISGKLIRAMFGEPETQGGVQPPRPALGLARRFGEMLLNTNASDRHAFVQENAGPVFVQREGLPAIIARFDEEHRAVAGATIDSVEMVNMQRVEIVFLLGNGQRRTVAMNVGGTPDQVKFAGFHHGE